MSLSLTVLGTTTPYPQPGRACSGSLVRAGGKKVWVDAGPGTLANLQRHTATEDLDAIWISHLHGDHTADLTSAFYALAYGGLAVDRGIDVYAPEGLARRLGGFFAQDDSRFLRGFLELNVLHDAHELELGRLHLTARGVHHDVQAYGLRAEYDGRSLVFSGDSGPCPALDELAAGADLLLCEAEHDQWPAATPQWHHTPEDTGALALRAGVGRLVVTHIGPTLTPRRALARAAAAFGGPTVLAVEGDVHLV